MVVQYGIPGKNASPKVLMGPQERVTAKVAAKTEVCGCSVRHPREECISQGSHGTAGAAGLSKRLVNRKADCFNLLR